MKALSDVYAIKQENATVLTVLLLPVGRNMESVEAHLFYGLLDCAEVRQMPFV